MKAPQSSAPPRANDSLPINPQESLIAVPVHADIGEIGRALDRAIPQRLWTIDKAGQTCVPPQRVKVLGLTVKLTPTLRCRIVGDVTRGALAISGSGQNLVVTMPLRAVVSARDVGGILKRETATANAQVRAIVRLSLANDWSLRGKVDISYDWTREPGIDFLGQRIEFTSKADAKLAAVVAKLERTLPAELAKVQIRPRIQQAWAGAFTSLQLNRANPPVWMRITPRSLHFGGYTVHGREIVVRMGMKALTETFVGNRPPDPARTALPPLAPLEGKAGVLTFMIPVVADYAQLEPVIARALARRSARPFDLPKFGPINARFGKVTVYGTDGGRIAVGVQFTASDPAGRVADANGTVWLTATPRNAENSRVVSFADLAVAGVTDSIGTDLLLALAATPAMSQTIAEALTQDFARDYDQLMGKITRAIDEKREGRLLIRARIDAVKTGQLKAAGQGLYLPVWGTGTASVELGR